MKMSSEQLEAAVSRMIRIHDAGDVIRFNGAIAEVRAALKETQAVREQHAASSAASKDDVRKACDAYDAKYYEGESVKGVDQADAECMKAALEAIEPTQSPFQARVSAWMGQCFVPSLYSNMTERGDRLLEEVLELLQSNGYDESRVATLVRHVFGRPAGAPSQEVGGVMVTLAGYCWIAGLDMHANGETELLRINQPEVMAKIRAKQEMKNSLHFDTPLPGGSQPAQPSVPSPNDIAYLIQADHDFEAFGETSVPYKALIHLESLGLMQCEHFTVTEQGEKLIAAHDGM